MSLAPWVITPDAAALLDFLAEVFGAEELGRVPGTQGGIGHAETRIGDDVVITLDAREGWPATPAFLRIHVDDVAGVVERATARGGRVVTPPTHLVFGEVVARIADPWDNLWWVHEKVEDVDVTTMILRMQDPAALATMAGFEDSLHEEMSSRSTAG